MLLASKSKFQEIYLISILIKTFLSKALFKGFIKLRFYLSMLKDI